MRFYYRILILFCLDSLLLFKSLNELENGRISLISNIVIKVKICLLISCYYWSEI